jgi:hypothetical protein
MARGGIAQIDDVAERVGRVHASGFQLPASR